ncbi:MAG: hypothetical protein LBT30_05165 [Clostridiales bacterium]|jgi:predicted DsbA family dithiol-disulfide isomerase|nr:hypothetical protein [Clostridiales bacterium]
MRTEAQREADKRYQKKKRASGSVAQFNVTLPAAEAKEISEAIKEAGMTQPEFIRKAYEIIFKEKL